MLRCMRKKLFFQTRQHSRMYTVRLPTICVSVAPLDVSNVGEGVYLPLGIPTAFDTHTQWGPSTRDPYLRGQNDTQL